SCSVFQDIIIPDQDAIIQDMDIFDGHLVLFLQRRNLPALCSIELPIDVDLNVSMRPLQVDELKPWFFPLPSDLCSFIPATNHDFQTSNYRVVISSPVAPENLPQLSWEMPKARRPTPLSQAGQGARPGRTPRQTRRGALPPDQVEGDIPARPGRGPPPAGLGGVHPRQTRQEGTPPPDQAGGYPSPDQAGGGEGIGPSWHEAGSGLHKLNSVLDFIACGKYLVKEGFVLKDKLCAIGCSAGGLLVGATMNMCPGLFSAAILKVMEHSFFHIYFVPFVNICASAF
ncbi:hypothetical protein Taro_050170, partial [Colocasia esculenta]|nr:hypothetical protein [Colocasia esculenta]